MNINTNVSALNTMHAQSRAQADLERSIQRLSSGLRINSAKDDAAGIAVASRMTTQIRGLNQARRNANDGISLLQTAEGALSTITENLQRIRELTVQAENASNSQTDRQSLQQEVSQLLREVDRVAGNTTFNGDAVFSADTTNFAGDANKRAVMDGLKLGWLEEAEQRISTYYGLTADGAGLNIKLTGYSDGAGGVMAFVSGDGTAGGRLTNLTLQIDMADFSPPNLPDGGTAPMYADRVIAHEMVHAVMARTTNFTSFSTWFKEGMAELIHGADERVAADIAAAGGGNAGISTIVNNIGTWAADSAHYSSGYLATRYLHSKLISAGFNGIKDFTQYLTSTNATLDAALTHFFGGGYDESAFITEFKANGVNFVNNNVNLTNSDTGAIGGADVDGGSIKTDKNIMTDYGTKYGTDVTSGFTETFEDISNNTTGRALSFQIGAQANQTLTTSIAAVNTQALGISDIDLTTNRRTALVHVDQALDRVNLQRANIAAQLSRFDSIISNLQDASINASAARSRIEDADYASETSSLVRAQILQQAAQSMLAQANAAPRLALDLLR